jgi:hypothetical protein
VGAAIGVGDGTFRKTSRELRGRPGEIEALSRTHTLRSEDSFQMLRWMAKFFESPSVPTRDSIRRDWPSDAHSAVTMPFPAGPSDFS